MRRTIKSFVLRTGRMTTRQQQGLETHLPQYLVQAADKPLDFNSLFHRDAPTVVEIGFGMGASLLKMAQDNPDYNYLGIEVHRAGLGALAIAAAEAGLSNLRIMDQDAVEVLKTQISDQSLAGVQIFFPDPWPKKKHHKRRLIQPEFIHLIQQKLKSGGFLHCATDWQDYAEQMLAVLSAESGLKNQQPEGGFSPRPAHRPLTKFELRGERLGHGVWDLIFIRQ